MISEIMFANVISFPYYSLMHKINNLIFYKMETIYNTEKFEEIYNSSYHKRSSAIKAMPENVYKNYLKFSHERYIEKRTRTKKEKKTLSNVFKNQWSSYVENVNDGMMVKSGFIEPIDIYDKTAFMAFIKFHNGVNNIIDLCIK